VVPLDRAPFDGAPAAVPAVQWSKLLVVEDRELVFESMQIMEGFAAAVGSYKLLFSLPEAGQPSSPSGKNPWECSVTFQFIDGMWGRV